MNFPVRNISCGFFFTNFKYVVRKLLFHLAWPLLQFVCRWRRGSRVQVLTALKKSIWAWNKRAEGKGWHDRGYRGGGGKWRIYKRGHTHTDEEHDTQMWFATHREISGTLCRIWVFLDLIYFLNVLQLRDRLRAECGIGSACQSMGTHQLFSSSRHSPQDPAHNIWCTILVSAPKCLRRAIFYFLIPSQAAFWMIGKLQPHQWVLFALPPLT